MTSFSSTTSSSSSSSPKKAEKFSETQILAFLLIVSALVFIPFLGTTPMIDPTDSFFTESAREMLELKSFSSTFINYEPWLDKPALHFWFIILAFKMFGINEFAGRLPSALSGIFEVIATYWFGRQILTRRQASLAAAIMLSLPLFVVVGKVSLTDETLSLYLSTALFSFAIAYIKKNARFLIPAYISLAIAILIKGPFGVVLVGLIVLAFLILIHVPKLDVRKIDFAGIFKSILALKPFAGVAAILVLTLPYYVWAHIATDGAFTTAFFFRQNFGRMVGVVNHVRPFYWYIPIALGGFFPWSVLVPFAGPWALKIWNRKNLIDDKRLQLLVFAACWFVVTFTFFSAIPTKLYTYIIPLTPAFAILLGCFVDALLRARRLLPLKMVASALLAGLAIGPFVICKIFDKTGAFLPLEVPGAIAIFMAATVALALFLRRRFLTATATLCGALITFTALFVPLMFALYYNVYQLPIDNLVAYAIKRNANLAVVYFLEPSTTFHYGRQLPLIKNEKEMCEYGDSSDKPQWILIGDDMLSVLSWTNRSPRVVAYDGHWWLFAIGRNLKKETPTLWEGLIHPYPTIQEVEQRDKSSSR